MKHLLFLILASLLFVSCGGDNEDDAWTTLSNAVDSLYHGNYDAYINCVDSQDIVDINKDVFLLSLKQQHPRLSDSDSISCIMDDINSENDTAIIKYQIIKNQEDTTYCLQKMVFSNGKWKIKVK